MFSSFSIFFDISHSHFSTFLLVFYFFFFLPYLIFSLSFLILSYFSLLLTSIHLLLYIRTFNTGQLLAKAKFTGGNIKNGKLVFPCCFLGENCYQTVMIKNSSNFPAIFKIFVEDFQGISSTSGKKKILVSDKIIFLYLYHHFIYFHIFVIKRCITSNSLLFFMCFLFLLFYFHISFIYFLFLYSVYLFPISVSHFCICNSQHFLFNFLTFVFYFIF